MFRQPYGGHEVVVPLSGRKFRQRNAQTQRPGPDAKGHSVEFIIIKYPMSLKLPLPSDFFKCPTLSTAELFHYKQMGLQSVQELIAKADINNPKYDWSLVTDDLNFRLYKGLSIVPSILHCGVIEAVGTVDEVVELFRTDTTEQAKDYCQRTGRNLVDAVNLYDIMHPTEEYPHDKIQIKWIVGKSNFGGIIKKRDFCCLETTQELYSNGRRMWVRAYKSIDLACCPDLYSSVGLVRGSLNGSGHVFIESPDRPGYLTMSYVNHFTVNGTTPDWVAQQASQSRSRNVLDIDRFLRENRLSSTPFLTPKQWEPLEKWPNCLVCEKKFGPMRKKTNCTKCGHVVCTNCNRPWNVKVLGTISKVLVCIRCTVKGLKEVTKGADHIYSDSIAVARSAESLTWESEGDSSPEYESLILPSSSHPNRVAIKQLY